MSKMKKHSFGSILADGIIHSIVGAYALMCIIPFLYVIVYSIIPYSDYISNPMSIIPRNVNFNAYREVLRFPLIQSAYKVTIFLTVVGTFVNIFMLVISAYPLSKKDLKGRNFVLNMIIVTMFFGGGMIPHYYLVRNLGLINTVWVLILPSALGTYQLILMKNFLGQIPESLEESAVMDGANEITVLFRIILPLSLPAIATFTLFNAVGHWNTFFAAVLYINKRSLWPLMLVLREITTSGVDLIKSGAGEQVEESNRALPYTKQMAAIVITMLPIMLTYPFFAEILYERTVSWFH